MKRHIVFVNPQIHWNTGAAGRTCLAVDATFHLIRPLGFEIDSTHVKRAGLDYWKDVDLKIWDSFQEFLEGEKVTQEEIFLFSRFGQKSYWETDWPERSFLVFGSETKGLPLEIKKQFKEKVFRIPTNHRIRSLNLSTSMAIVLFESLKASGWNPPPFEDDIPIDEL